MHRESLLQMWSASGWSFASDTWMEIARMNMHTHPTGATDRGWKPQWLPTAPWKQSRAIRTLEMGQGPEDTGLSRARRTVERKVRALIFRCRVLHRRDGGRDEIFPSAVLRSHSKLAPETNGEFSVEGRLPMIGDPSA